MKKLISIALITLSPLALPGCLVQGGGVFNGRVVDVEWKGIFVKDCEVQFQLGQQSSSVSRGFTFDSVLCDQLAKQSGNVVLVKYASHVIAPLFGSSAYELVSVEAAK